MLLHRYRRFTLAAIAAVAAFGATTTPALAGADVTLEPVARGLYAVKTVNGEEFSIVQPYNTPLLNGFLTGSQIATGDLTNSRGLFVFDLPAAPSGQIAISASLRLLVPTRLGVVNGPHEITIHGVDATIAELEASSASFSDLGAGDPFAGPVTLVEADEGSTVEFSLNESGLAALNGALGGEWALSSRSDREGEFDVDHCCFANSGTLGDFSDGKSQLLISWGTPQPPLTLTIDTVAKTVALSGSDSGTLNLFTPSLFFTSWQLDLTGVNDVFQSVGVSSGGTSAWFSLSPGPISALQDSGFTITGGSSPSVTLALYAGAAEQELSGLEVGVSYAGLSAANQAIFESMIGQTMPLIAGSGFGGIEVVEAPPAPSCNADLNGDGVVDGADLGILLAAWGDCPTEDPKP